MVFDTNLVIAHLRREELLPSRAILPVFVVGELKAFALKNGWQARRLALLKYIVENYPIPDIAPEPPDLFARVDAYSQGRLPGQPLPNGLSARNMGKNDLWIAATALYLELPLHTTDNDFDHLPPLGLGLVKELPA